MRHVRLSHVLMTIAITAPVGGIPAPAHAAVTRIGNVVQEPSPYEARSPAATRC